MSNPSKVHAEIGKGTGYAIAIVIGLVAVGFVAAWLLGAFSDSTVERRGQTAQQEQTQGDGRYRIAQYDAFFDLCNRIEATEGDIDASAANTSGLPPALNAQNLAAQQSTRRVGDYNARAAESGTAGQFRDSSLPYSITTTYQPNGAHTACSA